MQGKSIKLKLFKTLYGILIFIVTVIVVSKLFNEDNADMTAQMADPTLPMVTLLSGGEEINPLQGYVKEMDVSHMRGTILPIGMSRNVTFKVATYGNKIDKLSFEVRNITGKGLVENTQITDYTESGEYITGTIQLKDLITLGKEYMLVLLIDTEHGTTRYYTRVVWAENDSKYHLQEELSFVKGFSEATFDKEAMQEYSKNLESNSEGDNTTFNKVNIHSSFSQVTWGTLDILEHTKPLVYVNDIHSQTGTYKLRYMVKVRDGAISRVYNVNEAFRVRYTVDRIYLLNYERTMDYIFDTATYSASSNVIGLSISSPQLQLVESSGGSAFAFVSENRLYTYNNTENKLAYLFGFYDLKKEDVRSQWDDCSIKILKVDEAGNVKFAVAGYMNRGIHEGEVGIAVYDYNASINAVEEQAFIDSDKAPEILTQYMDNIAYCNNNDVFFAMLDQNIYAIDLTDRTAASVVDDLGGSEYKISSSESTIAWQSEDMEALNMMDLNTKTISDIKADDDEYIRLLGFMGDDLVYGLVREDDVQNDQVGNPIYAMYAIKIQDKDGNLLENYHPDGVYVTAVDIVDNQIRLSRVVKDEESQKYVSTYDDQIMSTLKTEKGSNVLNQVSVDVFEKIMQIKAKSDIKAKQLRVLTPAQTLFEGDRNVKIDSARDQTGKPLYYVRGLLGMEGIYADPAKAVAKAYEAPATVTDDSNRYIWYKGNLLKSNQIMSITKSAESYSDMTSKDSVAVCLDLILLFKGVNRNVEALLENGDSVTQILGSSFPEATILDLDGCPLSSMLYYVNQDIPVMAIMNDGSAMLVIGFNDLNTVLMNPKTGTVYKYGMNDSEKLFEENGNHFITYIMED